MINIVVAVEPSSMPAKPAETTAAWQSRPHTRRRDEAHGEQRLHDDYDANEHMVAARCLQLQVHQKAHDQPCRAKHVVMQCQSNKDGGVTERVRLAHEGPRVRLRDRPIQLRAKCFPSRG